MEVQHTFQVMRVYRLHRCHLHPVDPNPLGRPLNGWKNHLIKPKQRKMVSWSPMFSRVVKNTSHKIENSLIQNVQKLENRNIFIASMRIYYITILYDNFMVDIASPSLTYFLMIWLNKIGFLIWSRFLSNCIKSNLANKKKYFNLSDYSVGRSVYLSRETIDNQ